MNNHKIFFNYPSILTTLFITVLVVIASSAYVYYSNVKKELKSVAENKLAAFADFKVNQIIEWRKERESEALFIFNSTSFQKRVYHFLGNNADAQLKNDVINWIHQLVKNHEYTDALIVYSPNKIYSLYKEDELSLDPYELTLYNKVLDSKAPLLSDVHLHNGDTLTLSAFIPFISSSGSAVFILRLDPQQILFPMISDPAVPSESSESFLVRKDGDRVLFLMDLKKLKTSALQYSLPLTRLDVPAVKAVTGKLGFVEGVDYKGTPVLAFINSVPGTNWFLISKTDISEVYAPLREKTYFILVFSLLLLLVTGSGIMISLNNQKSKYLKGQLKLEKEKKSLFEHLELLLKHANDSILLIDAQGYIMDVNDKALRVYGYSRDEFLKLNISSIRDKKEKTFQQTRMEIDSSDGLIYRLNHVRKNGDVFPVEISSMKINLNGQNFYQSIIRDISEQLLFEKSLRESRNRMNRSQAIAHLGSWELDLISDKLTWSDEVYRIFGLQPQEFGASYEAFLHHVHPDDRKAVDDAYSSSLKDGKDTYEIEHRIIRHNSGEIRIVHEKCEHIRDRKGNIIRSIGMVHDITDKRLAEESLSKAQAAVSDILSSISDAFFAVDTQWNLIYINKVARLFGFNEDYLGKNIWDEFPFFKNTPLEFNCRKAFNENKAVNFEWKPRLMNKWFNITAYPSNSGLSLFVQDVTNDVDSKHLLKKMISEREILIREIHHRVKNNLQIINSLINLQLAHLQDDNMKRLFLDSQNRIKSMALIHQELYSESFSGVNSKYYFGNLIRHLINTYSVDERNIIFNIRVSEHQLPIDLATPLGLIATEIISNAFKYAFPGNLSGSINFTFNECGKDYYLLKISDNGIGFSHDFDFNNSNTLGLHLISLLCDQIKAELKVSSEGGTSYQIRFLNN